MNFAKLLIAAGLTLQCLQLVEAPEHPRRGLDRSDLYDEREAIRLELKDLWGDIARFEPADSEEWAIRDEWERRAQMLRIRRDEITLLLKADESR